MRINLYYNSILIKRTRIENKAQYNQIYKVTLFGKKKLFGANVVTINLKPIKLLSATDKEIDLNCVVYEGADL